MKTTTTPNPGTSLTDRFIAACEMMYLKAQVAFSVCIIIFGIVYAVRCAVAKSGDVYVICFTAIAYVGYSFMYRASIAELREERARRAS